jgi:CheY-like chemotaxis protein
MDERHDGGNFPDSVASGLSREQGHAFKNIFSIIIANAEMIGEEVAASGPTRRRLERIVEASRRGEQLVAEIRNPPSPQRPAAVEPLVPPAPEPCPVIEPRLVMVVDDEPDVVEIIRRYLNKEGLGVQGFTDSLQAWDWLQADPFRCDLVITDLDMPQLSGAVLCDQLQSIRPDLPVIMVTGYDRQISSDQMADFGIRAILLKPLDRTGLLGTVRRLLAA